MKERVRRDCTGEGVKGRDENEIRGDCIVKVMEGK